MQLGAVRGDDRGLGPKNGRVAEPGLSAVAPGSGVIRMPPVSVCHQVSTIGHLFSPTTSWYQSQTSGLIGSPTVPRSFMDFLEVFLTGASPCLMMALMAVGAV